MAKFCDNCGAAVEQGKKFCNQCGARVESEVNEKAPPGSPVKQQAPSFPNDPPARPSPPVGQRPQASSQQTMALYDKDIDYTPPPTRPNTPQAFAPKPQAVYPQQNNNAAYPPPYYPSRGPDLTNRSMTAPEGLPMTLIYLLVMSIPVFGLIPAIMWGTKKDSGYRGVIAIAMIIVNAIWSVIAIICIYQFFSILSQFADVSFKMFWQ